MIIRWREFAEIRHRLEVVRFYDLASTEPKPSNKDPDWTAGVTLGLDRTLAQWYVVHASRIQATPANVIRWMRERTEVDEDLFSRPVPLRIEKEGGSGGAYAEELFFKEFVGYDIQLRRPKGSKRDRFRPFSIQAENGRVHVVEGWNPGECFDELELFPDGEHDDWADASSGAMRELSRSESVASSAVDPEESMPSTALTFLA